ncbi:MAG: GAF domain-containing sensor histidine kinase [Anaerolineae bacterium]|nr:GAF domain-containing sensor histidine kinase [Anaerolineae bacterium]
MTINYGDSSASQAKIEALSEAIRAVTSENLNLDQTLRRLAEIAAHLVNARYAALGVPDDRGGLENFFTYGMTEKQIAHMDHLPLGNGLLGSLLTHPSAIRLNDMRADPRSAGFCAGHPRMTSFLGVPIISKGQCLGSLYLSDRLDDLPFSEDDERMVGLLAGHAAIAIENARLSEQLRKLAVLDERDRIAMELHDGIIQQIYAIGLQLEMVRTSPTLPADFDPKLTGVGQHLNRVIEDLRRYILDLKTGVDKTVTLTEELNELAEGFRAISSVPLKIDIAPSYLHLSDEASHAITQIVRESFSNIVRHAQATKVELELRQTPTVTTVRIADDGQGFDVTQDSSGRGLKNMQRRVEELGGKLQLNSHRDEGTTITVTLPTPL